MGRRIILTVCSNNIHRSVITQLCLNRELVNIMKWSVTTPGRVWKRLVLKSPPVRKQC